MAFHLLERDRERGMRLGAVLEQAMQKIGHCTRSAATSAKTSVVRHLCEPLDVIVN